MAPLAIGWKSPQEEVAYTRRPRTCMAKAIGGVRDALLVTVFTLAGRVWQVENNRHILILRNRSRLK